MMKKLYIPFLALTLLIASIVASPKMSAAENFSIVSVVNDEAISAIDLLYRSELLLISSGQQNTKPNRDKVKNQALNSLIEEQLKLQEAKRQNIEVTEEDVQNGFQTLAEQNNLTSEEFTAMIKQQGIPKATLLAQIKAQVAWSKVIAQVLRPQVDVSENDINARLERLRENVGKTQYLIGKISLPFETEEEKRQLAQLSQQIIQEVQSKRTPFQVIASQFSRGPAAAKGGMLGWLYEAELPSDFASQILNLQDGQISQPIIQDDVYHLILLRQKRVVSEESLPSEDDVLNQIGLGRLDSLQQKYLSDIKSAAFIDNRI